MTAQATHIAPVAGSVPVNAVEHYLSEHAGIHADLPGRGLGWLEGIRRDALDRFAQLGFPGPREEAWKYTRVAPIEKRAFKHQGALCVGFDEDDIGRFLFGGLACHRLVFVNGRYAPQLSKRGKPAQGILVASMAEALGENPELMEPHLAQYADYGASGFAALSAAFMADGALVHLSRGASLDHPVHLVFIATGQEQAALAQPRIIVVAGESSQAQIIESYVSLGEGTYLTNAVTEVALAANASVEHYKLQHESVKAFHVATLQAHLERDSRFISHSVSFGGQLTRNDVNAVLDGEGTECRLNGLYMVDGRQHVDYHTVIDHAKPRGTSEEYYKGILGGRSRGVFSGRVHVHPNAQKTDAQQSNKNLLLSSDAEVDTKPELEIYADDVKCSHGATVGQLDADMLFYLRARGIDQGAARGLLTYGFAQDIIARMPIEPIRDRLEETLVTRVPDAEQVKEML